MEPLISIKTIPIALEFKINNARLECKNASADVEVSRQEGGGLKIKSRPIKLNLDTFEARNSVTPTPMRSVDQYAQKGKSAAYEATATLAQEGKLLLNAKVGEDTIGQIMKNRVAVPTGFNIEFLPKTGPEITATEPDLTIQYQMDKLNFDWKVSKGDFEFIPGNIEISITQRPDVVIEYIGGPIYVPPSSDPEYNIDVKV